MSKTGLRFPFRWSGRPRWWMVLTVGGACYLLLLGAVSVTANDNFVPALLLIGALVPPSSVLAYAYGHSRRDLSLSLMLGTVLVSGVLAVVIAGVAEHALQTADLLSPLTIALVEEAAKLLVPATLAVVFARRHPSAGVVIGIAAGMGFGSLETMGYGLTALLNTGSFADVDHTLLLRGVLSPARHVAWTGMASAALWNTATSASVRQRLRSLALLLATLTAVVALHAVWDSADHLVLHSIVAGASVVGLLSVVRSQTPHSPAGTTTKVMAAQAETAQVESAQLGPSQVEPGALASGGVRR